MKKTIILVLGLLIASPVFAMDSDVEKGSINLATEGENITITHDMGTPDDTSDDIKISIPKKVFSKLIKVIGSKYTAAAVIVGLAILATDAGCVTSEMCPALPFGLEWGVIYKSVRDLGPATWKILASLVFNRKVEAD